MRLTNALFSSIYIVSCLISMAQPMQAKIVLPTQNNVQAAKSSPLQVQRGGVRDDLESADAYFEEGVELHRAHQFEQAIQAYQNAISVDPTFDSAYINLGLAYIQLSQLDSAIDAFQRVLALPERVEEPASNYTLAHYNLAIIYNRQGKTDEALAEVQQALAITPGFARAQQLQQQLQQPQESEQSQ